MLACAGAGDETSVDVGGGTDTISEADAGGDARVVPDVEAPDPCAGAVCLNGSECVADPDRTPRCECAAGFEGAHCETDIDDCAEVQCLEGGVCLDAVDGFQCVSAGLHRDVVRGEHRRLRRGAVSQRQHVCGPRRRLRLRLRTRIFRGPLRDRRGRLHTVKCWGRGNGGTNGQGNTDDIGDEPGEMGDALPPIDLGTEATPTSLISNNDGWFVCARFDNGGVKCWGRNTSSELGAEDKNNRGDEPDEMGDALPWLNLGTE